MKRVWLSAMILILVAVTPIPSLAQTPSPPAPSDPVASCKRLSSVKNATALQAACERALSTTRLPDYLCEQSTKLSSRRTVQEPGGEDGWTRIVDPQDNKYNTFREIVAKVRYVDGTESYTDIKVNGHPTDLSMLEVSGATGQFSSVLQALFDAQNKTEFTFTRDDTLNSKPALLYEFRVKRENNSNLQFLRIRGKLIYPGYSGRLWIQKDTDQPIRLEMQSAQLPGKLRSLELRLRVDYAEVHLGDGSKFVLPIKADSYICGVYGSGCRRNLTTFFNFRKFQAEHRVLPTE